MKILVDPKAVLFLLGTEMDYKADKMQAQFIFNNPNQVSACGCGGVQLTPRRSGSPTASSESRKRRLEGWPCESRPLSRRWSRLGPARLGTWTAIS